MPIDTTTTGYTFFDLSEQARARALHTVQTRHATGEAGDPDQLATALVAAVTTAVGCPDRSRADLEATVWDEGRCPRFSLYGTLYPATAPAVSWPGGITAVSLAWHRRIHVHHTGRRPAAADVELIRATVQATVAAAWQAAHRALAARQALEWVAAQRPRFTAAGALLTDQNIRRNR